MNVEWRSGAKAEVLEALAWHEASQEGLGEALFRDLVSRRALLMEYPFIGRKIDERHRQYRLKKFRYALIYRVEGDVIVISAVAHGSRRPGYWRDDPPGVREMPASYLVERLHPVDRAA
jgi:plasmid stabilization system protein ParE